MSSLYSSLTDFVTGRSLLEGDRAVCIVLDLDQDPRAVYYPTDMAVVTSLPIIGRVGEHDSFVPELDDYAAEVFGYTIRSNWNAFAAKTRQGPAGYEIREHLTHRMLLAPAYVSESTFKNLGAMSSPEDDRRQAAWNAAEIFHDALLRYRAGDKEEPMRVLMLDDPCQDDWTVADGRVIAVPDIMRRVNASECQLDNLLRSALKQTMRAADTIFDVEAAYSRLLDLRSFSVGLFKIGKYFQPSRRAGDMNLVENAAFMIDEVKSILGSANLEPEEIEILRQRIDGLLEGLAPPRISA